jgi:rubrerythrin
LDLDQIFAYAIDQEIKAMEFYERSASQTDIAEAQALFRSLARMEAGHRRALEEERKVLKETGQLKPPKIKKLPPEEETLVSLKRVAAVLKEANVILQDKHRHIQAELELAGQIQESFLPKTVPQLPNLQISVNCIMAE